MAKRTTPVTEAEKDEPGVILVRPYVEGQGTLDVYLRVEEVDDLDGKTTEDVQTLRFAAPVWVEPEEDSEDTEGHWSLQHKEIDLSKASREKLDKALKSFVDAARDYTPEVRFSAQTAVSSGSPDLSAWTRRAKKWLGENRKEIGVDETTRGRLKAEHAKIYLDNNPDDPRP